MDDSHFTLPPTQLVTGRQTYVIERCRGKKVLHVGCVDSGLTQARLRSGELLHARLHEVASELWGVDVDPAGVELLAQRFHNVFVLPADRIAQDARLAAQRFDVIVASELLEHLSNPGQFLDAVQRLMLPEHTELLVSVPNATRLPLLWTTPRGVERVHPEHVCWYSHATITRLLRRHGLRVEHTAMYLAAGLPSLRGPRPRRSLPQLARRALGLPQRVAMHCAVRLMPYFADGVLVVARRPAGSA